MTTTAATKAPLAPDQPNPFNIPGSSAILFIQPNTVDSSVAVWVEQGGPVDGWTYTFTTEAVALAEARRAYRAFAAHANAAGIDRRRQQLAMELATEQHRARRRMHNPGRTAAIVHEQDQLMSFGDIHSRQQLTNHLTRSNAA